MSSTSRTEISLGGQGRGFSKGAGSYFSRYLFGNLFEENTSIEKAFDLAVKRETIWWKAIPHLFTFIETPQLHWQNVDPSQLYLCSTSLSKKQ